MPIYEYTCQKCSNTFEKLVRSMRDADKVECPKCKSSKTARSLSVFAAVSGKAQGGGGEDAAPGMCGRCGGPGPCGFDG